jgi:PAS domain S-box-containing protein
MEVDVNKVYTWTNSAGKAFFGDDVVGKEAAFYFEGEQITYQSVQPLFSGYQDLIYVESWQRRKDGEKRLLAWWCKVLKNERGNVTGALSSARDLTDRKQAEEAIRKANEDLERSNKELEQFAYVASHDLQEPLRMVASYTQLLEKRYKDKLDGDALDFINYAVDGATRMQRLINDLLAFSRVGMRGRPFERTDSSSALGQALANLQLTIEDEKAVVVNSDLPTVMADDTQLVQLFQNLIANAVKFRGNDSPQIQISASKGNDFIKEHPDLAPAGIRLDGKWVFSVHDNGIGIEEQYYERIFAIFQRLHTREAYQGTGIGLAICQRIVERHGGQIWVRSKVGEGSTFLFTLPQQ